MPIEFEPPPTQAMTRSGRRPARSSSVAARLVADDALQVAHDRWVRGRADGRADDVVRRGDRRDPVADRLADGLLQGARAGLDADHLGAEQAHALDVGRLAPAVLGAHVDDALQAEQRAGGGRRDAVLAGAGLGDDPVLAHPFGQQRLAERVVELVRAGVHEVFALEPDLAAGELGQPLGQVQRRRAAGEVAQQAAELGLVARVAAHGDPRRLELGERGHERLGDVLAAVGAEAMLDAGLHEGDPVGHAGDPPPTGLVPAVSGVSSTSPPPRTA